MSSIKKLLRLSYATGKPDFREIASGTIYRSLLDSSDIFLLYDGSKVLYIWVGHYASDTEKNAAELFAKEYIDKNKLDPATRVVTVQGREENADFEAVFKQTTPEPEDKEADEI